MGIFGGISEADSYQSGNYVIPGIFYFEIDALKHVEGRRGEQFFIAEVRTLYTTTSERPVGGSQSWIANLTKHDAALGNVKAFLAAAAKVPIEEVDEGGAEAAVSSENPFRGFLIKCEAIEITTKAGRPFTKCNWYPATKEDVEAAIDKQRVDAIAAAEAAKASEAASAATA